MRTLSPAARAYVLTVEALALAALGWSAGRDGLTHPLPAVWLTGFGILAMELSRRVGTHERSAGPSHDLFGVWLAPAALLASPLMTMLAAVALHGYHQWRLAPTTPAKRIFSTAVYGLAGWATGMAGTLVAVPLYQVVCAVLVAGVLRVSGQSTTWKGALWDAESLQFDISEACLAVLVVLTWAAEPVLAVLFVPVVAFGQRALRYSAARTDTKTGAAMLDHWQEVAAAEIARARRLHTPLAVLVADIDHFKRVNDDHGHLAGDRMLQAVAGALLGEVRRYDFVGRFGGEEFVVVLPGADERAAARTAERLRCVIADLREPAPVGPAPLHVTISIGVAVLSEDLPSLTALLQGADQALYEAKRLGRDRVCLWPEGQPELAERSDSAAPGGTQPRAQAES